MEVRCASQDSNWRVALTTFMRATIVGRGMGSQRLSGMPRTRSWLPKTFKETVSPLCRSRSSGGEVAFAGVDLEFVAVFFDFNVDGPILAVALEEGGFVGNEVAAANDLLKIDETTFETAHGTGRKRGAARKVGDGVQSVLA